MACSSLYLRKPRQVVSLVSRSCTSMLHDHHHLRPLITTRRLSAFSSSDIPAASKTCNNSSNPWLMLTPEMGPLSSGVFKFYSLAEEKVITIDRKNLKDQLGLGSKEEVKLECKGSSHGWLVLFDRCSSGLFLYNPLSARHLKLPTIRNLEAIRKDNLESGHGCVTKVILSSSDPEGDPNCHALMIHGNWHNLAFCCPSSSSEWIETYQRYDDVVSAGGGGGLFFGVNDSKWPYPEFEGWDLRDLSRPRLISLEDRIDKDYGTTFPWKGYSSSKRWRWRAREPNFLVPASSAGNNSMLFYVRLHRGDWDLNKMDIHVHKFDFEKRELVPCMDGSLEGLALFVGRNHSFALTAGEDEHVKPDSIYFTHPEDAYTRADTSLGRSRIEVYNYRDATFSPLFRTARKKKYRTLNPPVWYTPTTD